MNVLAAIRHMRLLRRLSLGEVYRPAVCSLVVCVTLLIALLGAVLVGYLLV